MRITHQNCNFCYYTLKNTLKWYTQILHIKMGAVILNTLFQTFRKQNTPLGCSYNARLQAMMFYSTARLSNYYYYLMFMFGMLCIMRAYGNDPFQPSLSKIMIAKYKIFVCFFFFIV